MLDQATQTLVWTRCQPSLVGLILSVPKLAEPRVGPSLVRAADTSEEGTSPWGSPPALGQCGPHASLSLPL